MRSKRRTPHMVALVGMLSAMALALLLIASVLPSGWTGLTAIAGLTVAVAVSTAGYMAGVFCYLVSGVLALLLLPAKQVAVLFLCLFGLYPILKQVIERLGRRGVECLLKLVFCDGVLTVLYCGFFTLFFAQADAAWAAPVPLLLPLLGLGSVIFLLYDYAFSRVMGMLQARIIARLRQRFSGS